MLATRKGSYMLRFFASYFPKALALEALAAFLPALAALVASEALES